MTSQVFLLKFLKCISIGYLWKYGVYSIDYQNNSVLLDVKNHRFDYLLTIVLTLLINFLSNCFVFWNGSLRLVF